MATLLQNALLADFDPPTVEAGCLRIAAGRIVERGASLAPQPGDEVVDCGGCVVLPGLINGHTHLYSALATGMPMPSKWPKNFHEVLKFIWWRLDRALDLDGVEHSARIGAIDALRCGTTTLIDHHASPNAILDSLDRVEVGLASVGVRGVLCYEVTDRNGMDGRDEGIEETRRYLKRCASRADGKFAAMIGAHASFTCGNETMEQLAAVAADYPRAGVHIHVAEDPVDEQYCWLDHASSLIDRLAKYGMIQPENAFGHCTHLDDRAYAIMAEAGVHLAHNTRSNMNNSVGYTPVGKLRMPVLLGTDGIGANMFSEAQTAWFKSCDAKAGISPATVIAMLATNGRRASQALGVTVGKLEVGAAADVVLTSYLPATPITGDTLAAHFIFSMGSQHVRDVMTDGKWAIRAGQFVAADEAAYRRAAVPAAKKMWDAMAEIPLE